MMKNGEEMKDPHILLKRRFDLLLCIASLLELHDLLIPILSKAINTQLKIIGR